MGRQQGPDKGLSQEAMDAMISELQTLCEEAAEERKLTWWLTRDILVKYLRARSWNVKKAHTMLSTSLEWRTKMRPETIRWPEVEDDCRCGKMYRLKCTDLDGRPVILMRPANEEHYGEHDRNIKFLTYILEGIVRSMPHEGDGKMNIIIDFRGWTLRNAPPLKTTKETISILQNQYPERLYKAFLFNPPGIFSIFWSMARPFLDAVTVAKVNFVYAKDKRSTELLEKSFNLDELESGVGGRLDEVYNHDEYSLRMTEEEKGIDANGLSTTDVKIAEATTDTAPASESEPNGSTAAAPAPEGVVVQDSEAAS